MSRKRNQAEHAHHIIIERQPGESLEAWQRTIDELTASDRIIVTPQKDGALALKWKQTGPMA